ncbi:hypothetical protein BX666DRAFT_1003340 [Dichotomocladium elegans]|nr:hypothetical protein BX666DRAFT_1003340 [Dichotomocladium elegans]
MLATIVLSRPCAQSVPRPCLRRLSSRKIATSSSSANSKSPIATPKPSTTTSPPASFWRRRSDQDEKEASKGMSHLLVHTPGGPGLVRRPVSFKRAVRVALSIKLDGSAIALDMRDNDHRNVIQTIQHLAEKYQEYMHRITLLLTHLQRHDRAIAVVLQKNTLHINLPDSLFMPHSPSRTRANAWLQRMGILPDTPGFEIREEHYTSTTKPEVAIVGPGYFRDIQRFLDEVDHMLERSSMTFSKTPPKIPTEQ